MRFWRIEVSDKPKPKPKPMPIKQLVVLILGGLPPPRILATSYLIGFGSGFVTDFGTTILTSKVSEI